MRRFVFNLETLLRHRRHLEEREREKLAWIHYRLETERQRLAELQARHADTRREMAQEKLPHYDTEEVGRYRSFLDRLEREIEQASARIRTLHAELEKQTELWVERSKDKKVLEKLRGKREREHLAAADKLEQKAVDEIVVTRFAGDKK